MRKRLFFAALCCAAAVLAACDKENEPANNGQNDNQQGTTGTADGHDWVDLGLPSGLKWATCNVGATAPEGYGNYYAWGETEPNGDYSWETYKYGSSEYELTKYVDDSYFGLNGFRDNKTMLDPEDDAATANWGGAWRMPTTDEWQELIDNCVWTWTTKNGVNGYEVKSSANGSSIFLPAAGWRYNGRMDNAGVVGYYWSSSLNTDYPYSAWSVFFASDCVYRFDDCFRCDGRSVRPVLP